MKPKAAASSSWAPPKKAAVHNTLPPITPPPHRIKRSLRFRPGERFWDLQPPESDDFIEQILYIFGLYVRFCLDQDIQFIKNFYTPSNASLYITADDVSDKTRLPILAKVYEALEEARKKSQLPERINTRELAEDLCVLEKGCIFEYALSDGRYPLWDRSQKMLGAVLKGMAATD